MLQKPPPGWAELQSKARHEKDPKKLARLIDEMNQLLSEYEKAATGRSEKGRPEKARPGKDRSEKKPPATGRRSTKKNKM
jgi:hypothetical protein